MHLENEVNQQLYYIQMGDLWKPDCSSVQTKNNMVFDEDGVQRLSTPVRAQQFLIGAGM